MRVLLPATAAVALAGCVPHYPGDPVGSYHVTGALQENECGAAVPALDPIVFEVELRTDRGQGFWRRPGAGLVSGSYDETRRAFSFMTSTAIQLFAGDPDPDFGTPGCAIDQRETVTGHIEDDEVATSAGDGGDADASADVTADAGAPTRLLGDNVIQMTPTAGSDCTPATSAGGGSFAALPCTIRYTLDGAEREPLE